MKKVKVNSWEEFEKEANKIISTTNTDPFYNYPVFRGHSRASWKLQTTLERYTEKTYTLRGYHSLLKKIKPTIESITLRKWNLPEFSKNTESPNREDYHGPPPGYEFMVYLRHHGFPSPLLDWTRSPYIASFFAFDENKATIDNEEFTAIYCCQICRGSIGDVEIIDLGPTITTHKRHVLQQAEYTICKKIEKDNHFSYGNHEEAFRNNTEDYKDKFFKFLIPSTERDKVMKKLDCMNINSYTLFDNEESLMKTLAFREIENQ